MPTVFMNDPATGRFALYDEAPGGGDFDDPNALRNRPLNNPLSWLANIYFHSDFNYLEVAFGPITVPVSHAAVTPVTPPAQSTSNWSWNNGATSDRLLYTHNLGYVPMILAAVGSNVVWPGMPVQLDLQGGIRFVTIYCTETQIRMKEFGATGAATLAAIAIDYTLIIFAKAPEPSGNILFDHDDVTGITEMGRRKFKSDRRYLQVAPGGSPFAVSYGGRTIDLRNGAPRAIRADGTGFDPVPEELGIALARMGHPTQSGSTQNWGWVYGAGMNYTGSYLGPGNIQVQAP